jgi:hypothetical protein
MDTVTFENLALRAHAAPWWGGVEFLLKDGKALAEPIVMKRHDPNISCEPTFRLTYGQAQVLIDDLWQSGLRPTEGHGSAGALQATQNHLDDMRRLVFEKDARTRPATA